MTQLSNDGGFHDEPYVDHMMNQAIEIGGIESVYPELIPNYDKWVTAQGEVIAVEDLTDQHLANIYAYLLRRKSTSKLGLIESEISRRGNVGLA